VKHLHAVVERPAAAADSGMVDGLLVDSWLEELIADS